MRAIKNYRVWRPRAVAGDGTIHKELNGGLITVTFQNLASGIALGLHL